MAQNPAKRKLPSFEPENVTWMGETDIELDSFSFTWAIKNYSDLSKLAQLNSPVFKGGPKTKNEWKVLLRPKNKVNSVEYVSLHLQLHEYGDQLNKYRSPRTPVKAEFQMSILDADGQPAINAFQSEPTFEFTKSKFNNSYGQRQVITSADLVDPTRCLLVNDTLKIFCQVWIHKEIKGTVVSCKRRPSDEQRAKVGKERLANDFGKMFQESIATDVIISAGGISFKAHKAVLSARSSVFAAMFNANMIERETATVNIPDFDNEVVNGMLEYLYTGETTVMARRALELFQIAEKYNLEGLKEDCEYAIGKSLSKENVAGVLVLAHNHNAPILKSRAISFINWNKEELLKLKSFQHAVKAFAHTGLFADLYLGTTK